MLDPRANPWRPDLAAEQLRGKVEADAFAKPSRHWVTAVTVPLVSAPKATEWASELLMGEAFDVYDVADGLAWGQCHADGYVGYVRTDALAPTPPSEPTVRITARIADLFSAPDIKTTRAARLPFGALISAQDADGHTDFLQTKLGYLPRAHVRPVAGDPVAMAERFLGAPYLWGGRSSEGLDCSGLVQVMMGAAGLRCPRDSDMQASLGSEVAGPLRRGDLIFWKGHVGIMQSPQQLLHATAHSMSVISEPLETVRDRIAATTSGPITAQRRVLEAGV